MKKTRGACLARPSSERESRRFAIRDSRSFPVRTHDAHKTQNVVPTPAFLYNQTTTSPRSFKPSRQRQKNNTTAAAAHVAHSRSSKRRPVQVCSSTTTSRSHGSVQEQAGEEGSFDVFLIQDEGQGAAPMAMWGPWIRKKYTPFAGGGRMMMVRHPPPLPPQHRPDHPDLWKNTHTLHRRTSRRTGRSRRETRPTPW